MAYPAVTLPLKGLVFLLYLPPHRLWQVGVTAHRTWAAAGAQSGGENLRGCRATTTPMRYSVLRLLTAIFKFLNAAVAVKSVDIWMSFNLTERSIQ